MRPHTISLRRTPQLALYTRVYTACAFSQQPYSITIQVDASGEYATAERSMTKSSISHGDVVEVLAIQWFSFKIGLVAELECKMWANETLLILNE